MDAVLGHEQKFEDLCEALRSKIKSFKRSNPNLSGLQIAKIFGMASSTLNRIENRSIRTPSIDQVVKVLRGVGAHDELIGFMDEHYPAISDTFRKHISVSKTQLLDNETVKIIFEQRYFRIFMLAASGRGISSRDVLTTLGTNGVNRANELVAKKILKLDGENYTLDDKSGLMFDAYSVKELMLKTVSNFYTPKNDSVIEKAVLSLDTFSVRDGEVAKQVVQILRSARSQILNLVDSEENKGNNKYFIALSCDAIL